MAQRFGGKYSPLPSTSKGADGPHPPTLPAAPDQRRASLLGVAALALILPGFLGDQRQLLLALASGGTLLLAALLTREGIRAAEAFAARAVARRPALPRKMAGAILTALALGLGSLAQQTGLLLPLLIGLAGLVLHLLAFGPDPLHDKGAEGIDPFQTDRVARAVDEAEAHLAAMKDAILRAGDRALEARVERFAQIARGLFRSVESDPRDLTAARKFLSVYLMGARDATVRFADLYARNRSQQARADYETLLGELETTFANRTTALLADGHTDLDVEIAVLRDRLKLET
ncbi:5-bromo-4-chloroindolyl phosphate hydrolysis family protein [Tabrizicola oligotrophica]|uniref:5-bromo-4-chloroindolyl phosphate hydrolysis protein n=1 Tax=Tabrizicola oligotrophica TaxID=2710650 RepID=A0A6M0QTZ4_9RHOB|nr:5-bromo-4-chloroindolyl phosphate hydrolysis family protein [Tabrizicola oligotrophica]NEY90867.1 hypothetical protein [Tabrizicola oligotrophica]